MTKKDKITVEAFVHWKQGDDFADYLEEYSPVKALEMWGKDLVESGQRLIKASEILAGQDIKADAGTHYIGLYDVDRKLAEKLFELGVFHQDHFEKEHEECGGCSECVDDLFDSDVEEMLKEIEEEKLNENQE